MNGDNMGHVTAAEAKRLQGAVHHEIDALITKRTHVSRKLREALAHRWPIGSIVWVRLSHIQINLSRAEVAGHEGNGTVFVRLFTVNRRGNRTCKYVYYVNVYDEAGGGR